MLNDAQMERLLGKMTRLETTMEPYLFTRIGTMETRMLETGEQLHEIPGEDAPWKPAAEGAVWGGAWQYAWFTGTVAVPEAYAGRRVYLRPDVGGYEAMLWVNGMPYGTFATKIVQTGHGNHYCDMIALSADPAEPVEVAVEFYAGHSILGTQPFEVVPPNNWRHVFHSMDICVKNDDIADFLFDLRTLNQLASSLDPLSFRRADVQNCLLEVFQAVSLSPEQTDASVWRPALARAREIMAPVLCAVNAESAPMAGIMGHSHMDTAWLWPIRETVKKCARTFSNQISLMDQYPEYRFIQSSAYHLEMIRLHYPQLFEAIRKKIAEGRYEPNGGVWVECDCNLTSGESMVRQFLWGQRYTQQHFGYTADAFWLPDTFGYSAAIPQIMKGSRVQYFLTTKMSWNDTNRFPFESFWWEGLDGTRVFTHFNTTHCWPEPKALLEQLEGRTGTNSIRNKRVARRRLMAYGFGDGGGGPQFEMIEMARRVRDLDGVPKAEHMSVSRFMAELSGEAREVPVHKGELYLELHRGTLTNQHEIKRNNRKAELLLRDLEFLTVRNAVASEETASGETIRPLMEILLVNQFHDILPGTCIPEVHDQCHEEMRGVLEKGEQLVTAALTTIVAPPATDTWEQLSLMTVDAPAAGGAGEQQVPMHAATVTLYNTLGFDRRDDVVMHDLPGWRPEASTVACQRFTDLSGTPRMVLGGLCLPAFSGTGVAFTVQDAPGTQGTLENSPANDTPFRYDGNTLETPHARVRFGSDGTIVSFVEKTGQRELRGAGLPLNTFLLAEDLPASWDNWDVDADIAYKYETPAVLLSREVAADGPVQFRLRSRYRLSEKTTLTQDMVFHAGTPQVDFETVMDWQDKHRFLKAGFDTSIQAMHARHEIQFGHSLKPTTRNHSWEQAMFEVLNHRYTDLSETRFGVAMLNDCKYGVSVEGGDIRLSLHKGGCRPDPRGDAGLHAFTYAFLPHVGGYSAENAVRPGYCLNVPVRVLQGGQPFASLLSVGADHVVAETIKPCEEEARAFILRLYEAEGTRGCTSIRFGFPVRDVVETNLLEEVIGEPFGLGTDNGDAGSGHCVEGLVFQPFQIRSFRVAF